MNNTQRIPPSFINQTGSQPPPPSENHSPEDKKIATVANNALIVAPKKLEWKQRIVKWIRSIPTVLLRIFKNLFKCKPKIAPPAISYPAEKLIQKKESLDPEVVSIVLKSLRNEKSNLHSELKRLKFDSLENWLTWNELKTQIDNGLEVLEELNLLLDSTDKQVQSLNTIADQFKTLKLYFENKMKSNAPAVKKLEKAAAYMYTNSSPEELEAAKKNPQTLQTLIEAAKEKMELAKTQKQQSKEFIQTLLNPPIFKNENNNCWFHSGLQILWTLGPDFTRMVHDKVAKRNELESLGMDQEEIIKTMWDKNAHKDGEDPFPLLDALYDYAKAIEAGDTKAVQLMQKNIQRSAVNLFPTLRTDGVQQDTVEFLVKTLEFLTPPFFNLTKNVRGEGNFSSITRDERQPGHILNLQLKNQVNFQTILNSNFLPVTQSESRNINGIPVPSYIEQEKISVDGPPPAFLFVQLMRAEQVPLADISAQQKRNDEKINELTKKLCDKDKDLDQETAKFVAEQTLIDEGLLPEIIAQRKNESPVALPDNNRIDFSKAFGLNDSHPSYQYELHGTVIHMGEGSDNDGGHYRANVRGTNPTNGKSTWYECNDAPSKADLMDYRKALTDNQGAYFYFFRRVPAKNESR